MAQIRFPRGSAALLMVLAMSACAGTAPPVATLPADAALDARSLGRRASAERPAAVQVTDNPGSTMLLYTVSPRLQTGSPGSPPIVVTSLGAEQPRGGGDAAFRALVVVSNARAFANFTRAATRQGEAVTVQVLSRERQCANGCLYVEALMLALPTSMVQTAVDSGSPLRLRISGSAAYVEAGIPAGHLRALAEAVAAVPRR